MLQIILLFFATALFYSLAGFGGGSSYIALLALFSFDYETIPIIALLCNLIVVSGGCYHFIKQKYFRWQLFWPFAITSIPFAYLGGSIKISKYFFFLTLGITLAIAGLRILYTEWLKPKARKEDIKEINIFIGLLVGALLGLLSGLIGIGGGIFLAPFLINAKWAKAKEIAAVCSAFICVNSISGLIGQLLKNILSTNIIIDNWPLFLSVFLGGQIGSRLVVFKLSPTCLKTLTAILILIVGCRILFF